MYKLNVYIPLKYKEVVKSAMFKQGAGNVGNYDSCCFEVIGMGQFRPLKGSQPHLGQQNIIEVVEEVRVELVVPDSKIHDVVKAMKEAHPYETVAYDVFKMEEI